MISSICAERRRQERQKRRGDFACRKHQPIAEGRKLFLAYFGTLPRTARRTIRSGSADKEGSTPERKFEAFKAKHMKILANCNIN